MAAVGGRRARRNASILFESQLPVEAAKGYYESVPGSPYTAVVLRYCGTRHGSHASWSSLSSRLALRGSSICIDHRIEARPIVELKDEAEDKTLRPGRGRSYVSWPPMCSKKFSYFHDRPSYTVEDTGVHSEFTGA